jgi:hypothetical protein
MGISHLLHFPVILTMVLTTLVLLAVVLVANGIGAWYEERMRRVGAVVRKGAQLASGFGAFRGVAQNLDARSGGELVRREQTQVSTQAQGGAAWRNRACVTTARPFVLVLESGVELEVDARQPELFGFPETTPGAYTLAPFEPPRREMFARVSAGDEIWVTGVLAPPIVGVGGAYRSNASRRQLRAPRRGEIELSKESPVERWKGRAAAHKRGVHAALAGLVLLHTGFFRSVDRVLFDAPTSLDFSVGRELHRAAFLVGPVAAVVTIGVVALWLHLVRRARRSPER